MKNAHYHVFVIDSGTDDILYIGWTQKVLSEEGEKIFSDLVESSSRDIAHWVVEALHSGKINIFEIESASSMEAAKDSVIFWRQYYHSLGLDVIMDHR